MENTKEWHWRCCNGFILRSAFCPKCGTACPENQSEETVVLADIEAQRNSLYSQAKTLRNKANAIEACKDLESAKNNMFPESGTWGDEHYRLTQQAIGVEKKAAVLNKYAKVIKSLMDRIEALQKGT